MCMHKSANVYHVYLRNNLYAFVTAFPHVSLLYFIVSRHTSCAKELGSTMYLRTSRCISLKYDQQCDLSRATTTHGLITSSATKTDSRSHGYERVTLSKNLEERATVFTRLPYN